MRRVLLSSVVATQVLLVGVLSAAGTTYSGIAAPTSVVAGTAGWVLPAAPVAPGGGGGPPEVRLAVAGDVGTGAAPEWATAELMDAAEQSALFDALLLLGDNAYPHGDPARLGATVFAPFASVLDGATRLVAVLGNHDVEQDNAPGQMTALGMPWRWYVHDVGPVRIVVLDSTLPDSPDQLAFLESALAGAPGPWTIVALHHPPYSAGAHGSDLGVRAAFEPAFVKYGVDLVLAGHEHDYERSNPVAGVTYVVSGAAAKVRPAGRSGFTAVSAAALHFVTIDVWGERMVVTAHAASGIIDRFVLEAD